MNVFNSVKGLHPRRNAFSAHTYRNDLTSQMGVNIPVYQQHVTAGTRVRLSANALVRLQALIAPVMDNIDFYVHFWKIPYRLLENDKFTQFFSGEIDPADYDAPFYTPADLAEYLFLEVIDLGENPINDYAKIVGPGSIFDYLGYDSGLFGHLEADAGADFGYKIVGANNVTKFNIRPFVAYYQLHLHWYMNENVPYFDTDSYYGYSFEYLVQLISCIKIDTDCDPKEALAALICSSYYLFGSTLLPHGWEKDYFTSALPNVQFGDPVSLPIAGTAPVSGLTGSLYAMTDEGSESVPYGDGGNLAIEELSGRVQSDGGDNLQLAIGASTSKLVADLSEASAITINELRFANALQVFKERQMRYGRRRLEFYKGFFDVTPEDLRLHVPQYLGGGRIPINISDIEQTSQTSGSSALGHLAGKATAVAGGFAGFTTFCSEETIIIGIGFAMPHITYAQQTSKFLLKTNDIYDYFNPSFEHLGEQAIQNIEVYAGTDNPAGEFGYTPRYNEYRFHFNEMHGEFKSSLAYWTLGRIFSDTPALNADFVYMQPSVFDRIFAVSGQPSMLVSLLFRVRLIQPVSKYGTPMLLA